MKKVMMILMAGLMLISLNVYADDVSVDNNGNVTTGVSNTYANFEVTGASAEHAIMGTTSGTGAAGVIGVNWDSNYVGSLGTDEAGVAGENMSNNNQGMLGTEYYGIYGYSTGWAGYFEGNARVTGDLTVDGAVLGPSIGDITGVTAGVGLSGGATSGNAFIDADTTYLQRRVTGSCPAGSSIRVIDEGGVVTCEQDDVEDTDWTISGPNIYLGISGNVGIGTSSPGYKLEVRGSSDHWLGYFSNENTIGATALGLYSKGDAQGTGSGWGAGGEFRGYGGSTGGSAYGLRNFAYAYGSSNAYGVLSDATGGSTTGREYAFYGVGDGYFSGNVGIGTPDPGEKLTVAGTIESTSGGIKFPDGTTQSTAYRECAGNDENDIMVKVGPLCVDKYEASVWSGPSGGTQFGTSSDDYPCSDNGNDCSSTNPVYARSELGVTPAQYITWFQAQQACAMSGKRLLTNAEWQMAAAGTPDPGGTDNGATDCATYSSLSLTGSRSSCVSNWGVNDMVGNLWEWVADWMQDNEDNDAGEISTSTYGDDLISGIDEAAPESDRFPVALIRGGNWGRNYQAGVFALLGSEGPSTSGDGLGFRCAR